MVDQGVDSDIMRFLVRGSADALILLFDEDAEVLVDVWNDEQTHI